jgi:hypothetical protein
MCMKPYQRHLVFCLLFHILPLMALSGVLGRYEKWGILASYILLSQKPDLKEMQAIHFDRTSVWNFYKVPNSKYFWYFFES